MPGPPREVSRQVLHIAVGSIALLLHWLTWPQAATLAVAAILFNLLLLPRLAPGVLRPGDRNRLWQSGLVLYPVSVLALILVFRDRLDLAAAAWGILAAGDGAATLVGTHLRSTRLPWNGEKSVAGLVAFVAAGTPAAALLLAWTSGTPLTMWMVMIAAAATSVAALVETIPIRLDDNLTVPAAAAAVLWSAALYDPVVAAARWPDLLAQLGVALPANAAVAVVGVLAGTVTLPGALVGIGIGTTIATAAGWTAWLLLLATFAMASLTTRLGASRKQAAGIAEARGGRRGPGNAIANTGAAAWLAALSVGLADPALAVLALVASLATAGSDTVASEVGKAWGRTTWSVLRWTRVAPGTTGAASVEGTAAGIGAAALLASLGAGLDLVPWSSVPLVTAAATLASFCEGALGAAFEDRGILNNDTLNFINAALGAAISVTLWIWWHSA